MSKEENQSNEKIKTEENKEKEDKIEKIREKFEKKIQSEVEKKNEPIKQIIKEKNSSNFNQLKNFFENRELKNEKEKKEKIIYKKEEITKKIQEPLNLNIKNDEKKEENLNKIEEFKSDNVKRFLNEIKNKEILNKEKELNIQKEIKEKKIVNNKNIKNKVEQFISDYKKEEEKKKEIDYSFNNFVNQNSKVKENLYNIEKAANNLNQNKKLFELTNKIINQIYDNNSKSKSLSMQERIHLFDRKINNFNIIEKIQLNLNLKNLDKKGEYDAEIYDENNELIAKSEKKNDNKLIQDLQFNFSFTKQQAITIKINKFIPPDQIINSEIKVPIKEILKVNKNLDFEEKINNFDNNEIININYDAPKNQENDKFIKLHFESENKNNEINNNIANITYTIQKENNILFKSSVCNESNIKKSDKIPLKILEPEFEISFYNNYFDENKFIIQTNDLQKGILKNINLPGINMKNIKISSIETKKTSFVKLRKEGLNLDLSIAIDFTSSNGYPNSKFSLHYTNNGFINNYEKAIRANYNIISSYNDNDKYNVYGFGAIYKKKFLKCFNLNKNEEKISGIENIIKSYKNIKKEIIFSGGTYFSPVIDKINEELKKNINNKNLNYHILLIISDGIVEDINDIIDSVLESSKLPLSIIIIGVGYSVENDMKRLNGEYGKLISSKGEILEKDIIQYVHFNDYADNIEKLTDAVLKNIPEQISDYYDNLNK